MSHVENETAPHGRSVNLVRPQTRVSSPYKHHATTQRRPDLGIHVICQPRTPVDTTGRNSRDN
jgi:hypothetical protein